MDQPAGLISQKSSHGVDETVRRLRAAIEAAGLTLFAEIDHDAGAVAAGLELRPTRLVIFGAARGGTPLMQAAQTAGIDLPLKTLVWQDAAGDCWIGYNAPQWIADRHGLGSGVDGPVNAMTQLLGKLTATAAG